MQLFDEVGSTNEVAAEQARAGTPSGLVVIAESQTDGRGRLDRQWTSPPRAGLTFSLLLRPRAPVAHWPWLSGLVAAAAATALQERTAIDVRLKWPNDLVVGGRKLGGLLAEVVDDAVVVGVGINVTTRRNELPRTDATSLALEGAEATDRLPLLVSLLRKIGSDYVSWNDADGAPTNLPQTYRGLCTTIGRRVRADLLDGTQLEGEAVDVDAHGRLVIDVDGEHRPVAAGDVVHVHPGAP